jgi:arylsulfatase A-like enzyme
LNPNVGPLGETFQKAGYHTGYVGKWHLHGEDKEFIPKGPYRMGFQDWHAWCMTNNHYHSWTYNQDTGEKISPQGWQPTRMTDEAITFLKAQPKDKPWMLVLSWNPPHPPFNPPEVDTAPYPLDQIKFRPNVRLRPSVAGEKAAAPRPLTSQQALRKAAQGYMGGITGVDKEFARVLQALDEIGQAEDTIVVYTSDHGEMMGSQGRMAKQVPFEESCRVPFIVRYPGVTPERKRSDVLFAAVDIYPTLCGLAGVPVPAHCVGRDLSDVMRGRKVKEPEHVFLMNHVPHHIPQLKAESEVGVPAAQQPESRREEKGLDSREFVNQPSYRGIRTGTHTYAVADSGRWVLYDNIADPYQMKNLVQDESHRPLMKKLDEQIAAWITSTGDTFSYAEATQKISDFPA